jgi:hypothetical protein
MLPEAKNKKMYDIIVEKKLKIIACIFFGIIFVVVYFTTNIFNFSAIPELIGSDWLTVNNTGLLAEMGVRWWENHTALIVVQTFVAILALGLCFGIIWVGFFIIEAISLLGYYILAQKYSGIRYIFSELVDQSMISFFSFDYFLLKNKNKKIIIRFASILGAHILFFILTPFLILLWIIKWCSGGLFYLLKMAI